MSVEAIELIEKSLKPLFDGEESFKQVDLTHSLSTGNMDMVLKAPVRVENVTGYLELFVDPNALDSIRGEEELVNDEGLRKLLPEEPLGPALTVIESSGRVISAPLRIGSNFYLNRGVDYDTLEKWLISLRLGSSRYYLDTLLWNKQVALQQSMKAAAGDQTYDYRGIETMVVLPYDLTKLKGQISAGLMSRSAFNNLLTPRHP